MPANRFFTVTSLRDHVDPLNGNETGYESLLFPDQVFGDPGYAYPIEIQGRATGGFVVEITPIPDPPEFCGSGSVTLDASPGFDAYTWSDGQSGQTISVFVDTDTRISVEALDSASGNRHLYRAHSPRRRSEDQCEARSTGRYRLVYASGERIGEIPGGLP